MIRIVCLGKIKEDYLKKAIEDYEKRISKYHKIEIIELKDDEDIIKEENSIIKYIDLKNYNIAMVIEGKPVNSLDIAKIVDNTFTNYSNITFIIGSSNGLSDKIKSMVQCQMSFGSITIPHGLFRLVLLEQIYRAFKINNNESYHK